MDSIAARIDALRAEAHEVFLLARELRGGAGAERDFRDAVEWHSTLKAEMDRLLAGH